MLFKLSRISCCGRFSTRNCARGFFEQRQISLTCQLTHRILVTAAYSDLENGGHIPQTKINRLPLILLESVHELASRSPTTLRDLSCDFNPRAHSRLPEPSAYQNSPGLPWSLLATLRTEEGRRVGIEEAGRGQSKNQCAMLAIADANLLRTHVHQTGFRSCRQETGLKQASES